MASSSGTGHDAASGGVTLTPTSERERIRELIVSRLRDHLAAIASQDWDYFAGLRYRQEAEQAVSDLERLVYLYEKELDLA